jgi:homoserine O-acetyltransferase
MQALCLAALAPERLAACILVASAARHSAQNIAFQEVGRQAIRVDPEWHEGRYYERGRFPSKGLSVARMATHITYLSDQTLHRKFGRSLQDRDVLSYGFEADFQIESYLRHQGESFVERFDANSYFYITRAMNYFDMTQGPNETGGKNGLAAHFRGTKTRFLVVSFSSDWLYPTSESRLIVHALNQVAANVSFTEIISDKGHDAFLLENEEYHAVMRGFLKGLRW